MPTPTYTPLANATLATSALRIEITGISQLYRDLILVFDGKSTSGDIVMSIQFNNDSGSNYSVVQMFGSGTTAGSNSGTSALTVGNFDTGGGNSIINIMDYSATNKHKTVLTRFNYPAAYTVGNAGRWASTSAITSISLVVSANNFAAGSTFALFGIAA